MKCSKCKVNERHTRGSWCLACINADNLARYHRKKAEGSHASHRLSARKSHLKRMYGLSLEDYTNMYNTQDGKCAICQAPIEHTSEDRYKTACVDHCHETGKVRGLLCWDCNVGLGKFKDNCESLEAAVKYLRRFK